MFSTNVPTRVARDPSALRLRVWLIAMLLAPLVPWFTFPIPFLVLLGIGVASIFLTPGSIPLFGVAFTLLGVLLPVSAVLALFQVRNQDWRSALWSSMIHLGSGATLLGTFVLVTGLDAIERFGSMSPLAFLALASVPASWELSRRWLDERMRDAGPEARRIARTRLVILSVAFAGIVGGLFVALFAWAEAAISNLPLGHFYFQEQGIRETAARWFILSAMPTLVAMFAALLSLIGRGDRPSAVPS